MKNFSVLSFILLASLIPAQKKFILALSKTDKKMVVLDYSSLEIITKISVGDDPHEVITSTDGKTAYVANTINGTSHELTSLI